MIPSINQLLIPVTFGCSSESILSPRYYWDSERRGRDPFVILQWTLEGEGVFESDGTAHPVPKGTAFIVLIPEATKYYYQKQAREPWKVAWLNFYGPLALSLFRQLREAFGPVLPLPGESAAGVMARSLAMAAESHAVADAYEASVEAYSFIVEWLRELTRPMLRRADPVQAALALCSARFREPIGVKELAAATGLSREHFSRIFAETAGKSPARHLRDLRVAAARQMMRRQSVPLKEVALRCGFPSVRSMRHALESA